MVWMLKMKSLVIMLHFGLVFLATPVWACEAATGPSDACGASELQYLIGDDASVLEAMKFSQPVRFLRPGDFATMDFLPNRLNIRIDANEKIIEVACD